MEPVYLRWGSCPMEEGIAWDSVFLAEGESAQNWKEVLKDLGWRGWRRFESL